MEGCGHFLYAEEPRRFTKLLVDFIETTDAAELHTEDLNRLLGAEAADEVADKA